MIAQRLSGEPSPTSDYTTDSTRVVPSPVERCLTLADAACDPPWLWQSGRITHGPAAILCGVPSDSCEFSRAGRRALELGADAFQARGDLLEGYGELLQALGRGAAVGGRGDDRLDGGACVGHGGGDAPGAAAVGGDGLGDAPRAVLDGGAGPAGIVECAAGLADRVAAAD